MRNAGIQGQRTQQIIATSRPSASSILQSAGYSPLRAILPRAASLGETELEMALSSMSDHLRRRLRRQNAFYCVDETVGFGLKGSKMPYLSIRID
jgi:hypothetical protein